MASTNKLGDAQAFELHGPVAITADANGASIDLQGIGAENAVAVMNIGAVSGTSPTLDVTIQDSADDSTFANYTEPGASSAAAFAQKTATGGPFRLPLNLRGCRRYLRVNLDVGGTSPSFLTDIVLLVENKYPPAAAQS